MKDDLKWFSIPSISSKRTLTATTRFDMNDITRITLENSQSYVITTKVAPITVRCLFMSFQHALCNQYS